MRNETGALHSPPAADAVSAEQVPSRPAFGERGAVWTLWFTYGAFYFCRTNISAAVPGLKASPGDGGLGLGGDEVGWILASLKIAYGVGQLINGQLSERVSPRMLLAVGMFGSAALNVLFGFSAGFFFLLFVWATNGYCQSLGWTPCIRVVSNWVPVVRRGNAVGIIGTGYQITLGLTYLVAGHSAEWLGWRGALYVPAALLTLAGVLMLVLLRESPDDAAPAAGPVQTAPAAGRSHSIAQIVHWTLYNPALWLLGLSLGLLNACRYGFLDWGVTHLMETQRTGVGKAALQFFVIAIGATAGSYLAGWATDRFFGSRRAPVVCLLMVLLGILSLVYEPVVRASVPGTMSMLVVIGFCIYGPQVLLVGTAPADLAHRGTSAAAAGFVNFIGYMGAATGDVVTGYLSEASHGGWQIAIYVWAGWAFAGAVFSALLWNTTSRKIVLLPGYVPRIAGTATLAAAGTAVYLGRGSVGLTAATAVAAVCVTGSSFTRWAALPGLAAAFAGLLQVFLSATGSQAVVRWDQYAAIAAYGLAILAMIMVLVEQRGESCESSLSAPGAADV